mgnify:CR=1 FL=1
MILDRVTQSYYEKKCFLVARNLIEEIINLRSCFPEYINLSNDPKIKSLLDKLGKWTDALIDSQGGL